MTELPGSSRRASRLRQRVRYRFDILLSRGTWAVLLWLGGVTLLIVLASAALLRAFDVQFAGSENASWLEDFWQSLLRTLDPGTMASDTGWGGRLLALVVTVLGILIAGTLIGLIANGIEQRIEALRRGRSTVVESGHVVVLGASSRLPVIIEQLGLAGRARRANVVVVLADREPVELTEHLLATVDDLYGSRLVVRRGDRARSADLAMVGIHDARAVIVVADEETTGDGGVVRTVLAVGAELGGYDRVPVVAELADLETAESLVRASDGAVQAVVALRSVARVTAFALREPGLNQVVAELLDFRGCDLYVRDVDGLTGQSFGESVFRFSKVRPIGLMRTDGTVTLNPPPRTPLADGDRLVVIADDDTLQSPTRTRVAPPAAVPPGPRLHLGDDGREDHLLIIGWNSLGPQLLASLDQFARPGSTVEVVFDSRLYDADELMIPPLLRFDVKVTPSTAATWQLGDRTDASHITAIVLLAYRRGLSADAGDSRTLLTLMLLRRELDARVGPRPRIVVELVDAENVDLARVTGADDYVVSDSVTSRIMVQLAEQPERQAVLRSVYDPDGPSVHLVDAGTLGVAGRVGFDDIVVRAYGCGLLALGWRRGDDGVVVLNPRTSDHVELGDGDQIVVIG